MASGRSAVIAIVDLVAVCDVQQRWSQRLFEQCGVWVATTRHPPLQQLMAAATHRHAWHAELWGERRPAIPYDSPPAPPADDTAAPEGDAGRAAAYAGELQAMLAALDQIRAGADRALDPATHRTLDLVIADVAELDRRVAEAMPPGSVGEAPVDGASASEPVDDGARGRSPRVLRS